MKQQWNCYLPSNLCIYVFVCFLSLLYRIQVPWEYGPFHFVLEDTVSISLFYLYLSENEWSMKVIQIMTFYFWYLFFFLLSIYACSWHSLSFRSQDQPLKFWKCLYMLPSVRISIRTMFLPTCYHQKHNLALAQHFYLNTSLKSIKNLQLEISSFQIK